MFVLSASLPLGAARMPRRSETAAAQTLAYLKRRNVAKLKRLDAFEEGLVFHCQKGKVHVVCRCDDFSHVPL